jgi:hypothetical protein
MKSAVWLLNSSLVIMYHGASPVQTLYVNAFPEQRPAFGLTTATEHFASWAALEKFMIWRETTVANVAKMRPLKAVIVVRVKCLSCLVLLSLKRYISKKVFVTVYQQINLKQKVSYAFKKLLLQQK